MLLWRRCHPFASMMLALRIPSFWLGFGQLASRRRKIVHATNVVASVQQRSPRRPVTRVPEPSVGSVDTADACISNGAGVHALVPAIKDPAPPGTAAASPH